MFSRIAPVVVLSALLLTAACEEMRERYFHDYGELARSEDEPGNWVPSFIPRSAVEIRARFRIDTGAELLTFSFGAPGDISLAGRCTKASPSDVQLPPSKFLSVAWWPGSLSRDRAKSEDLARYELYRCERNAFLALERAEGRHQAFYWRISLN